MPLREFVRRLDVVDRFVSGGVSPAVDVKVVFDCLFGGGRPVAGHEVYCSREEFFSVTYPTAGMVRWLSVLFGVLAGRPGKNVFVLPAYLGAGKSHFLAFVLHVAALYRECRGVGQCVAKELKRYGIDVELPDLEGDLRVVLFHGGYATSPPWGSGVPTKDLLRRELEGRDPLLYLFDEAGMFDNRFGAQFADYMQLLSEAFVEAGPGRALVVSYSLASGQYSPPSLERLRRVDPLIIEMDAVRNIVHIVRRWAGIDKVPPYREFRDLVGVVPEDKVKEFHAKVVETYPFNPVALETLLLLAEESLVKASSIQLTRGLLQSALKALKSAVERGGGLVVHGDLPEPGEVVVPPPEFSKFWSSILGLYRRDEEMAGDDFVLRSVLRHVIYRSFVGRLMPRSGIYPDEAALILGNYDVVLGALPVSNAVRRLGEFRVQKTAGGYVYLPLPDEYEALARALVYVSDEEGAKAVHDEVEQLIKSVAKRFKRVALLGWKEGKAEGVSSFDDAKKAADYVGERDFSALLVDLRGTAQVPRRNNLFVVRAREGAVPGDVKEFLGKVAVPPDKLSEALYMLGRVKVAVDRVVEDLESYFPDIVQVEDKALRQALEDGVKARLEHIKEVARSHIRRHVERWLDEVLLGRRISASGGLEYLAKYLGSSKLDVVIEWALGRAQVFMRIGDLWDQWLNSDNAPPYPLSFDDFVEGLLRRCREDCNCVVREGGKYQWISEGGGCFYELRDPKNAEVALAYVEGSANEPVIEQFLAYLDSLGSVEFTYQRLGGEEVRRSLADVLREREDWIYLKHAKYRVEKRKKRLDVKINGVATTVAEVNPGDEVVIAVESDEKISRVMWEFAGVQHETTVNDVFFQFKVRVGEDPRYEVKIKAEFADGSTVDRDVYLNVRMRRRREVSTAVVNVGDVVVAVSASSAAEAVRLLERLKEDIIEVVEVRANESSEDLNLKLEFRGRRGHLQQARRLIKAVEPVTQNVGVTVKFKEPITVDKSLLESLGKGALLWTKIVEE